MNSMSQANPQIPPSEPVDDSAEQNGLVSVIIPTYNHARYVGQAIRSALDQEYRNFEVIVVDDGSTDNTPEVLAAFGDQIKSIRQPNQGLSAARNTGLKASRGTFVGLLDADDVWLPSYLATMVPVIASSEAVGAVYSGWGYIDSDGQVLPRSFVMTVPPDQFYRTFTFTNFLVPSGVVLRRRVFDTLGVFDTRFRACEDRDMWLRVSAKYQVKGVPQALVRYRVHPSNMTKDLSRMETSRQAVIEKHFGKEEGDPSAWPEMRSVAYGGFYLRMALDYFLIDNIEGGLQNLHRAFRVYPHLAEKLDVFYELSCAGQPPSVRGMSEYLDFEWSEKNLFAHLEAVFSNPGNPPGLQSKKEIAYANAHLALGLLAYDSHQMGRARRHMLRALGRQPGLALRSQALPTLLKSFLGPGLVKTLKQGIGKFGVGEER